MSVEKRFSISLDVKQPTSNRDIEVVEGDTGNVLVVTLTDNGEAVNLADCKVCAVFAKPNGKTAMQDTDGNGLSVAGAEQNEITIELYNTSFSPGMVTCEIQVFSGEDMGTLVTSAQFNFKCRRGIANEDTIQSTDEWPLLVGMLQQVAQAEDELVALHEETRETAEAADAATERANTAAENAEAVNAAAEAAEAERAAAELARINNETERDVGEEAREEAEQLREDEESIRQAQEQAREQAEAHRLASESARQANEAARESAEAAREADSAAAAERANTAAENAEAINAAAEEAETRRQEAELARIAAEEERLAAEAGREAYLSGITAWADTLPPEAAATAEWNGAAGLPRLLLGIPRGKDGRDAVNVSVDGMYYLEIVDGDLHVVVPDGGEMPPLSIDENGNLIYTIA